MAAKTQQRASRETILEEFARAGREHSDATVLFHTTLAGRLDLPPTDYKTLGILQRLGPQTAGEIARHSGLATASVTNLIDRLERKGFVRRVADAADRRRVLVEPIDERVTAARPLFASARRSLKPLLERYSARELSVITDFLARNAERLRSEIRKLDTATTARAPAVWPKGTDNRQRGHRRSRHDPGSVVSPSRRSFA